MQRFAFFLLCAVALQIRAANPAPLTVVGTIPLPGVKGRIDHLAIDSKRHRLLVAALGNNTLEVLDLEKGQRIKTVSGCAKPQGVAYLPALDQIVVANGSDGTVKLFDGGSYALLKSLTSMDDADNVRLDEKANLIYLGYGDGALAVIDSTTFTVAAKIKLPAHPESFQLEKQGTRIFVNLPDAKQVAVVDRKNQAVIASWPMTQFQANFPMSLDEANHRLLLGCRKPARLVVLDTETGQSVADLPISGDTDDLFYDAALKQIYVSCGMGSIDVVSQQDAGTYILRERIATASGARTSFFSADLRKFYLATPARGAQQAEVRVFQIPK